MGNSLCIIYVLRYAHHVFDFFPVKGLWIILLAGSPAELGASLMWKGTMLYTSISQVGKSSMLDFTYIYIHTYIYYGFV